MNAAAHRGIRRHGFTLVELLVALVIMASLVTVATVSVESTQLRARADKTSRMARAIADDLESADSLSFVSDFGRLPGNADEVKFLFSRTIINSSEVEQTAAAYQLQPVTLPENATPPLPTGEGPYDGLIKDAFGTAALGTTPMLGVGWRGPYSQAVQLRGSDGALIDGWGNLWDVEFESGKLDALRSRGRDGIVDVVPMPDWQDKDIRWPVRRNAVTDNIELHIDVVIRGLDGIKRTAESDFTALTLKILYFTPEFSASLPEEPGAVNKNIATVEFTRNIATPGWSEHPARAEQSTGDAFAVTVSGVTAGRRLIFLYAAGTPAGGTPAHFGGGARLVDVQPGTNRIEYTLIEL